MPAEPMRAIILFGHGARDPAWAAPLQRLRDVVREGAPEVRVELAFLEFLPPSLGEALDQLAEAGVSQIDVVPVFLAQSGHVKRDLPQILAEAGQRHPQLSIRLRQALGEAPEVIAAMAASVLRGH